MVKKVCPTIRFHEKYIPEPMSGCWLWIGHVNSWDYGIITCYGKNRMAHRLSYEIAFGEFPSELIVQHKCDTPPCVNPDHLMLGTHKTNKDDSVKKRRHAFGSRNGNSNLTEENVLRIRKEAETKSQAYIAKKYNMAKTQVSALVRRVTWKHI